MAFWKKIREGVKKYRVARKAALQRDISIGELKVKRVKLQEQVARSSANIRKYQEKTRKINPYGTDPFGFLTEIGSYGPRRSKTQKKPPNPLF